MATEMQDRSQCRDSTRQSVSNRRRGDGQTTKASPPFYQIHLSTMLVQALLFGFLLLIQGNVTRVETFDRQRWTVAEVELRGWPEVHSIKYVDQNEREKADHDALRRNMTWVFVVVLIAFLLEEAYLRRPRPRLTAGRVAAGLLLLAVLLYGFWRGHGEYRLQEFVCLNAAAKGQEFCSSYDAIEREEAWQILCNRCWFPVEDRAEVEAAVARLELDDVLDPRVGEHKQLWLPRERRETLGLR